VAFVTGRGRPVFTLELRAGAGAETDAGAGNWKEAAACCKSNDIQSPWSLGGVLTDALPSADPSLTSRAPQP